MKKILSTLMAAICVLACMFTFAACNEEHETLPIDGWETVTSATCTDEGLERRTLDHEQTRVIPALGHSYGEWQTSVPVSCTSDGTDTRICSRCGNPDIRTVEAHHTINGTNYDIDRHWSTCSVCNTQVEPTKHHFITEREEKYAYIYDNLYGYNRHLVRLPLGYVDISRCDSCDAIVHDACVVTAREGQCPRWLRGPDARSIQSRTLFLTTGRFNLELESFQELYGEFIGDFNITYDADFNPTYIDIGKGRYYQYDYQEGRITKVTYQLEDLITYGVQEPRCRYYDLTYDNDGNMIKTVLYFDDTPTRDTVEYDYYTDGTLQRITRLGSTIATYNESGLLSSAKHLEITNDTVKNGQRTKYTVNYNDGSTDAVFDVLAEYNDFGQLTSITEGYDGTTLRISYNEQQRISGIEVETVNSSGQKATTTYTYSYATLTNGFRLSLDNYFTLTYRRERTLLQS